MHNLLKGVHYFNSHIFGTKRELFHQLASGQKPSVLFITCSDSRINPNLLTQSEPGEIFVVRNAGNIIPAAPVGGGEVATIEYAVCALGIQDVVVCGHSDCGAMKGLLNGTEIELILPTVSSWLKHASRTLDIMQTDYQHLCGSELVAETIKQNVIVQIENLMTYPFIKSRIENGELNIHGWVYKFESGEVTTYDPENQRYSILQEAIKPRPVYPRPCGYVENIVYKSVAK